MRLIIRSLAKYTQHPSGTGWGNGAKFSINGVICYTEAPNDENDAKTINTLLEEASKSKESNPSPS